MEQKNGSGISIKQVALLGSHFFNGTFFATSKLSRQKVEAIQRRWNHATGKDQSASMQDVPVPHLWNYNGREGMRSDSSDNFPLTYRTTESAYLFQNLEYHLTYFVKL